MLKDSGLLAVSSGAGSLEKIRPWEQDINCEMTCCIHVGMLLPTS
jgi:hypothetical protein